MFPICDCQSYWDNVKKYHEDTTGLPTEHATWRISNHASSLLQLLKMLKAWSNGRNGVPKDMETLWKLRKNVRGLTIWPYLTRVMHRAIDPLFDTNTQCIQVSFPRVILRMFRLVRIRSSGVGEGNDCTGGGCLSGRCTANAFFRQLPTFPHLSTMVRFQFSAVNEHYLKSIFSPILKTSKNNPDVIFRKKSALPGGSFHRCGHHKDCGSGGLGWTKFVTRALQRGPAHIRGS